VVLRGRRVRDSLGAHSSFGLPASYRRRAHFGDAAERKHPNKDLIFLCASYVNFIFYDRNVRCERIVKGRFRLLSRNDCRYICDLDPTLIAWVPQELAATIAAKHFVRQYCDELDR
jgi:hypothetical protein